MTRETRKIRTRLRRTYRQRQQAKAALQGAALLTAMVGVVLFCMWWFPHVDCKTARSGLDFIERCEANPDCMLTVRERNLKQAYTRLAINSCPTPQRARLRNHGKIIN